MGKCSKCKLYPWNPEIDPDQLLVFRKCHNDSGPRRWTVLSRDEENDCKMFDPIEPVAAIEVEENKPIEPTEPVVPIEPVIDDGTPAVVNEQKAPIEPVAAKPGKKTAQG